MDPCVDLPAERGNYVLLICLDEPIDLLAGRLGSFRLGPGQYAYVGSARGPGGLRARLCRHLLAFGRRPHWHIDYLTAIRPIAGIWHQAASASFECLWASQLLALPGASAPIAGFGSSDCRSGCPAHLVRLPDRFDSDQISRMLPDCISFRP